MPQRLSIGFVAPSSPVPSIEFKRGVARLKSEEFKTTVHPQCLKRSTFFAGTDEERAQAFYDLAVDPSIDLLWCARGGYGALRILPWLEEMTAQRGIPEQKLLVGYSDITALHEFVRHKWGWSTLHGPMPSFQRFDRIPPRYWKPLIKLLRREAEAHPAGSGGLRFIGKAPRKPIEAELVGGNLAVWASLMGTPYAPKPRQRILFLEDVGEGLYRLDRMVQQIQLSGGFEGVRAIVLGTFHGCTDVVPQVESSRPGKSRPLRPKLSLKAGIFEIFGGLGESLGIPVAYGLPVGHGEGHAPLPLGAQYRLTPQGVLVLQSWGWNRPT